MALDPRSGTSARGEWTAQDFVLETHDTYPKKMVFSVFGADRLQRFGIQVGQEVNVSFDIDAHEYNGRWFNSIRAWKVDRNLQAAAQPGAPVAPDAPFAAAPAAQAPFPPASAAPAAPSASPLPAADAGDDLPF